MTDRTLNAGLQPDLRTAQRAGISHSFARKLSLDFPFLILKIRERRSSGRGNKPHLSLYN